MRFGKEQLSKILEKQGNELRKRNPTLHFLCESISMDLVETLDKDHMLAEIAKEPSYQEVLIELLQDTKPDRSAQDFAMLENTLKEHKRIYTVPIASQPHSYADDRLLFQTAEQFIHWINTTSPVLFLEHGTSFAKIIDYIHVALRNNDSGIAVQFGIDYYEDTPRLYFTIRAVMEGDGFAKIFVYTPTNTGMSSLNHLKHIVDRLLGDQYEYSDILKQAPWL